MHLSYPFRHHWALASSAGAGAASSTTAAAWTVSGSASAVGTARASEVSRRVRGMMKRILTWPGLAWVGGSLWIREWVCWGLFLVFSRWCTRMAMERVVVVEMEGSIYIVSSRIFPEPSVLEMGMANGLRIGTILVFVSPRSAAPFSTELRVSSDLWWCCDADADADAERVVVEEGYVPMVIQF
ncbi:hypothetical protein BO86DRAFT_166243 [Aspergillus japonicus CBS 114.51]|uniref:Uncharacterized protein n=1 Tax=Aspergillus japonicus CBS 114.51 TaxID=1448312 RepID=A0A8T8XC18_ASPJA|nr:hypothetical protein BO86DRAFT_166243 [Aspergillus japonicus CBS 114.51]RAH85783.1 hypothetical protein BO86DRAFT_166243 [Aspergillus japonicus CBS 114.51]